MRRRMVVQQVEIQQLGRRASWREVGSVPGTVDWWAGSPQQAPGWVETSSRQRGTQTSDLFWLPWKPCVGTEWVSCCWGKRIQLKATVQSHPQWVLKTGPQEFNSFLHTCVIHEHILTGFVKTSLKYQAKLWKFPPSRSSYHFHAGPSCPSPLHFFFPMRKLLYSCSRTRAFPTQDVYEIAPY